MKLPKSIQRELDGCLINSKNLNKKKYLIERNNYLLYGGNHVMQIMKYFDTNDSKILELGAGTGWASLLLYDYGFTNVVATDINNYLWTGLKTIKKINPKARIKTKIMSMEKISFPDQTFDYVFMISTLHHTNDVYKVASEVYRVLKPDGLWFVCGEPIRGLFDKDNQEMNNAVKQGFNDHFYKFSHYKKSIKRAGFGFELLFPDELHLMLNNKLMMQTKITYKRNLFNIAKITYRSRIGRKLIRKMYKIVPYFVGCNTIMIGEK